MEDAAPTPSSPGRDQLLAAIDDARRRHERRAAVAAVLSARGVSMAKVTGYLTHGTIKFRLDRANVSAEVRVVTDHPTYSIWRSYAMGGSGTGRLLPGDAGTATLLIRRCDALCDALLDDVFSTDAWRVTMSTALRDRDGEFPFRT